ncbi:RagB/SusD family nutrient uptake outer membrane protein [Niabella yanshanensis]|uniref:RagB/SusD family nutrient uptake outer membrane protein n=1 Tax=Niabella yanshanensis TaxID=577386 RepID=A0ABZ0WAN2_9BACT|nr:RagB/SusD family nutrient uptake outer membrane protein [Niabella yanshanensis]WQD38612.1 RagB/SusD family nutrient uptake outer membrane protein [Niabella yanshanensis]
MKRLFFISIVSTALIISSCKKFLDIVPDGIATIDNAFSTRISAEKYLFTCYSYMPQQGSLASNPSFSAGEEFFCATADISTNGALGGAVGSNILYGNQNSNSPYADAWTGYSTLNSPGRSLYQGISDCNIFLENIDKVPDMQPEEKQRWRAEVVFLKAYYHFWLVRQYGPIYLLKSNLPVGVSIAESKVYRNTLDECFEYIEQQLDEVLANEAMPDFISNEAQELGRISKGIVHAFKAYVQVTAASPLFNGNMDYAGVVDNKGVAIFNPQKTEQQKSERWVKAAATAKAAVAFLERQGHYLYVFDQNLQVSEKTKTKLSIRGAVTENWNKEVVWGNPNCWTGGSSSANGQSAIASHNWPRGLVPTSTNANFTGRMNVPLNFVAKFYTKNGIPVEEDLTYDQAGMYNLRTATADDKYYIKEGYTTAGLNFDREPRFYADLIFDGGIWFGSSFLDEENPLYAEMKVTGSAGSYRANSHNLTGYTAKKLNHFRTTVVTGSTATAIYYAWPVIRLADVYLLCAEALNEAGADKAEILSYVDKVRARAGLNGVEQSWSTHSTRPDKPNTLAGRREIIQRERTIELAFEGHGYWDLRRWKTAYDQLNKPVTGWYVYGGTNETYYVPVTLYRPLFRIKDYFWPIAITEARKNENLVQNQGY